jgi:hypothetical protein
MAIDMDAFRREVADLMERPRGPEVSDA